MKILYVLKHNPWGIGGGCKASLSYFNAFMAVFEQADIDLCICEEYVKDMPEDAKRSVGHIYTSPERIITAKAASCVTGILHRHQRQVEHLLKVNTYDYCIFDHSAVAGSIVNKLPKETKSIVLNHNFEHDYFRDNTPSRLRRMMFLPQVVRNERKSYMNASFNIFLTKEDLCQFEDTYGLTHSKCESIGMFTSVNTPPEPLT